MAERAVRRPVGEIAAQRVLDVAVDDPEAIGHAVALGVLLGHHGVARGDLDAGDMDVGDARGDAQRRDARPDARLEQRVAGPARNGGGEEHRVDAGAIALFGLQHVEAPAEEPVVGQRRRDGCGAAGAGADFADSGVAGSALIVSVVGGWRHDRGIMTRKRYGGVTERGCGAGEIVLLDHQAARQCADRALHGAHVSVEHVGRDPLLLEHVGGIGQKHEIVGPYQFTHDIACCWTANLGQPPQRRQISGENTGKKRFAAVQPRGLTAPGPAPILAPASRGARSLALNDANGCV
jgi:hypothetical protein